MDVTLQCAAGRRRTVENLFQLYVHDFTEFWETRRVELDEDGRFPPYPPLAEYWAGEGGEPLLICADGELAGFVLINRHSQSGLPCDFGMGEFFVARHYRREGVGHAAALAAIRPRAGLWEIPIARRNTPALRFWRRVAAALSQQVEDRDQADAKWNGTILRFRRTHPATI